MRMKSWGCGGHSCIVISHAWVKNHSPHRGVCMRDSSKCDRSAQGHFWDHGLLSYHHGRCFHFSPYISVPSGICGA